MPEKHNFSIRSGVPRFDGRLGQDLRPVTIERNYLETGEGSVIVKFGRTTVLCVASFVPGVPRWREGSGKGWVTGEYAMLPRATNTRNSREAVKGKVSGRTQEISRLLGRALRAVVNMEALGENTIMLDCDVLQADGGTRTAAITGAYVALHEAVTWAIDNQQVHAKQVEDILSSSVSAVSVGLVDGRAVLDLAYEEDSRAQTDMNVVATGNGEIIEVQGTAEGAPFSRAELDHLLDLAIWGTNQLSKKQAEVLSS